MKNEPLVMERTYDAPVEKVWSALTDPVKMKQWYFDIPDFKAEVGSEFSFISGGDSGCDSGGGYVHKCKVTRAIPNEVIAYTWTYPEIGGESEVSFELFDENGKTRLLLTHKGLETFQTDNKDFKRESFNGGWTYFSGALGEFLAK